MSNTFRALVVDRAGDGFAAALKTLRESDLPPGDTLVRVTHSALNYTDGMALQGKVGLVPSYPHIPGVDLAGVVERTEHPRYRPGDEVVLTGWGVGYERWGGFSERTRVQGDWLVPLPHGLTLKRAMAIGTAGLTAMLAIDALEHNGLRRDQGDVLVTGASGGVGSVAVSLLAALGYRVVASSGKGGDYLLGLGAAEVMDRNELSAPSDKLLEEERWAAVIDSVGSTTLARAIAQTRYGGGVAASGRVAGRDVPVTIAPFIMRGVRLLGINAVYCPFERRAAAWERIATLLPGERIDGMISATARLEDLPSLAQRILAGEVSGRIVVEISA
jgi:acrylyl-CoA reductase (NADPH)